MPGPDGPWRMMVYGTMFQPSCVDTRYAASSRPARVPSGKSHSGASPEIGLYTQCTLDSPSVDSHKKVALLAERMRPRTVSSPSRNTSRSSCSLFFGVIVRPEQRAALIAVRARTDVALRVQRFVAQRARRTSRRDDAVGTSGELPRRLRRQKHAHRGGAPLGVVEDARC